MFWKNESDDVTVDFEDIENKEQKRTRFREKYTIKYADKQTALIDINVIGLSFKANNLSLGDTTAISFYHENGETTSPNGEPIQYPIKISENKEGVVVGLFVDLDEDSIDRLGKLIMEEQKAQILESQQQL